MADGGKLHGCAALVVATKTPRMRGRMRRKVRAFKLPARASILFRSHSSIFSHRKAAKTKPRIDKVYEYELITISLPILRYLNVHNCRDTA